MNGDHVSPDSRPPIFTTSHRSPRLLSTTTCTNSTDYCKMFFFGLCCKKKKNPTFSRGGGFHFGRAAQQAAEKLHSLGQTTKCWADRETIKATTLRPFSRGVFQPGCGRLGFSDLVFNSTSDPRNCVVLEAGGKKASAD